MITTFIRLEVKGGVNSDTKVNKSGKEKKSMNEEFRKWLQRGYEISKRREERERKRKYIYYKKACR